MRRKKTEKFTSGRPPKGKTPPSRKRNLDESNFNLMNSQNIQQENVEQSKSQINLNEEEEEKPEDKNKVLEYIGDPDNVKQFAKGKNLRNIKDKEDYDYILKNDLKKEKYVKNKVFLAMKRQKPKKSPSATQALINFIVKKKPASRHGVEDILAGKGYMDEPALTNIAWLISQTKIVNEKVVLSDRISEKPLYEYYPTYLENVIALTNDVLYLWMILCSDCQADTDESMMPRLLKKLITETGILEYCQITSSPTNYEGEAKKGYYQDFSGDFLALNLESLPEEQREAILNLEAPDTYKFSYDGGDYIARGNRAACVICLEDTDADYVRDAYDGMEKIKIDKGRLALGENILPIKKKPKFLNCKLKGERFCPCYMIFPKPINIAAFYKIKLDLNELFDSLDEQLREYNGIYAPKNICYWDNLDSFVDFMWVYTLTSPVLDEAEYENLKNSFLYSLRNYEDNKGAFSAWRTNQLDLQRIVYEFYNAFNTKINYDKMMKLKDRIKKFIENRALLNKHPSKDALNEFFNTFKQNSIYIARQLTPKCQIVADMILKCLEKFEDGKITNKKEIQKVGIYIYFLSSTPDDSPEVYPSFPFILSPGAFLGNVISEGVDNFKGDDKGRNNILEQIIDEYNNSQEIIQNNNEEALEKMLGTVENFKGEFKKALDAGIINQAKEINEKINKNDFDKIIEGATKEINNNGELLKKVKMRVLASKSAKDPPKNIDFSNIDGFTEAVESAMKTLNIVKEEIKKNIELKNIQMQKRINNLKQGLKENNNIINDINNNEPVKEINKKTKSKNKKNRKEKSIAQSDDIADDFFEGVFDNEKQSFLQKPSSTYTKSVSGVSKAGEKDISNADNLFDFLDEVKKKNGDLKNTYQKYSTNNEIIRDSEWDFIKKYYLLAAANNDVLQNKDGGDLRFYDYKKSPDLLQKMYPLSKEQLAYADNENYSFMKELDNLHYDPKYVPKYPKAKEGKAYDIFAKFKNTNMNFLEDIKEIPEEEKSEQNQ